MALKTLTTAIADSIRSKDITEWTDAEYDHVQDLIVNESRTFQEEQLYQDIASQRSPSPYLRDGRHSFFVDLALIRAALAPIRHIDSEPIPARQFPGRSNHASDGMPGARERMAEHQQWVTAKQRAGLTTTTGAGGEFAPEGWPAHLQDAWAHSVAALPSVASLFDIRPLPDDPGRTLDLTKITGGGFQVGIQAQEGASVMTNASPTTTKPTVAVGALAGRAVVSWQFWDFTHGPAADLALAEELAAQYVAAFDYQLVAGAAANGQALGLLNVAGVTTETHTQASPTFQTTMPVIAQAASINANARHQPPDTIIMHTRRYAWLSSQLDNNGHNQMTPSQTKMWPNLTIVQSTMVPTTDGSTMNRDRMIVCNSGDLVAYARGPITSLADQTDVATGQLEFVVRGYVASAANRYPEGITIIDGTGQVGQTGF